MCVCVRARACVRAYVCLCVLTKVDAHSLSLHTDGRGRAWSVVADNFFFLSLCFSPPCCAVSAAARNRPSSVQESAKKITDAEEINGRKTGRSRKENEKETLKDSKGEAKGDSGGEGNGKRDSVKNATTGNSSKDKQKKDPTPRASAEV